MPVTSLHYSFNSYKILDQDEAVLRNNGNPFAVVMLTALLAIVHKDITVEKLKDIKHDLYDEMIKRRMDKKTRQGLYDFLAYYVDFQNQENFHTFEREVETKLGRSNIMGTKEYLLDRAKREGIEKGVEEKSYEFVENLIRDTDFDDAKIASLAVVSVNFVKKIRAQKEKL